MKINFILTLLLFLPLLLSAQGYEIKVKIKQLPNTKLQLGYYFEDKQFIQDTVVTDKSGTAVFAGEKALAGGLYLIIAPRRYFDIILSDDQTFEVEADTLKWLETIKFSGSKENTAFYAYQNHVVEQVTKRNELNEQLKKTQNKDDSLQISAKINSINEHLDSYWRTVADENKGAFLSALLYGMNGEPSEGYTMQNFFNHIDFSDSRMLRTPVIYRALRMVLARNLNNYKPVSEIIREIDMMAEKAKANNDVYHYVLNHYLNFFNTFPRVGMNEVFIHLVEKYYQKETNDWMDEKSLEEINSRAQELKSNLPGQIAPDLMLEMPNEEYISLHQVDAKYTFLFFWTVGCGHCEEAIHELQKFYTEMKDKKVEIFAVYTKTDKKEWVDFIQKNNIEWINAYDPDQRTNFFQKYYVYSTPLMYMLDEKKEIKALRVGPEQIKDLLEQIVSQKDKF